MNKIFTIAIVTLVIQANAQTYLTKDFDDFSLNSGGWTTQIPVDTTDWTIGTIGGVLNGIYGYS